MVLRDVFRRQLSIGLNPSLGSGNPAAGPSSATPVVPLRRGQGPADPQAAQEAPRPSPEGTIRETVTLAPPLLSVSLPGWPGMPDEGVALHCWGEASAGPDPSAGPWRVELTLNAPHLGPLTITLWNRGERLDVHVACERADTAREVSERLPELVKELAETFVVGEAQAFPRRAREGRAVACGPEPNQPGIDVYL